jgi:pyridinium-3,5-biscarboxylic acid mononucleotide synthase
VSADPLLSLLERVAAGEASPAEALRALAWLPIEPVTGASTDSPAWARLDHHRTLRNGIPEVVFGQGKTAAQVVEICRRLDAHSGGFLATRLDAPTQQAIRHAFPAVEISELARTAHLRANGRGDAGSDVGPVLVASAGTSDLPVAEEAAVTLDALGVRHERLYDVGVAGLHRLIGSTDVIDRAAVVIAVAGMEGALASVLGGLVRVPVVAVPTSVGYGASFGGLAALLAMLNSCAAGVSVVNVDNGFGAACAAARMIQLAERQS